MGYEFRSDPDRLVFIVCVIGGLVLVLVNSLH